MTLHYSHEILSPLYGVRFNLSNNTKAPFVRVGRKKITTSFVCEPTVYNELAQKCKKYGDRSYIIEELIKQYLAGQVQVPSRIF